MASPCLICSYPRELTYSSIRQAPINFYLTMDDPLPCFLDPPFSPPPLRHRLFRESLRRACSDKRLTGRKKQTHKSAKRQDPCQASLSSLGKIGPSHHPRPPPPHPCLCRRRPWRRGGGSPCKPDPGQKDAGRNTNQTKETLARAVCGPALGIVS